MALTLKKVERATEPGRYGDGFGLYLEVRSARNRQWVFRYERVIRDERGRTLLKPSGRPRTREHWLGLGPAHTYDLDEARDLAREMRKRLREGEDPAAARAAERAEKAHAATIQQKTQLTFREAAEAFFASKSAQWRNKKHREQFTATLETYGPAKRQPLGTARGGAAGSGARAAAIRHPVQVGLLPRPRSETWRLHLGVGSMLPYRGENDGGCRAFPHRERAARVLPGRCGPRRCGGGGMSGVLKDAALAYAAKGIPVFPCKPADKSPLVGPDRDGGGRPVPGSGGFRKATCDLAQIDAWWTKHPDAMIGIPTGSASGIDVLDIDVKHDGFASVPGWEALSPVIVRTPSGGAHLWFKADGVHCTTSEIGPGVDTRGEGGYGRLRPQAGGIGRLPCASEGDRCAPQVPPRGHPLR
ncbi:bifunctional DNA primase/polymerase [Phenylobacterium soli]|uniref:DNA primase/polymerase bifunctional N-terminal domain-containing protein n=1 Tax=Phenylobacterium soli TaxID=2170551 RepID=A0A328AHK7_9CAUL|nr:hypothetical protein DJ017_05575 [Phenylobacterium soli]